MFSPSGNDPVALSSEWVAQKAGELDTLKRELGALKEYVGQQQKRRVAELHRGREKRIEAIMAELLPLPDTLQVPAPPTDGELEAAPAARAPSPHAATARLSTAPVATPSQRTKAASAPPMVTPSTSRTTIGYAASNASLASSKRVPTSKAKPGPSKPQAPPKLAPAAAALAAQMHESKYNRPSRILASTTAAAAAAKQRPK